MRWRILLLLAGIATSSAIAAASGKPAVVTFAHINDVYEIEAVEGGKYGGPARWATAIKRLKRTNSPVIVTLGGDYLSPSALGTAKVEGEPLAGRQMVDVLNAVGIDWATFGNHEFDVSEQAFRRHLAQARFKLVSTNVAEANGQPFASVATSMIVPVKAGGRTVRIGVIGITVDATEKPWVRYRDGIVAAREELAKLRGRTDAIVALTHLTLAQDAELVAALPELDLALGGHEHENWLMLRGRQFVPVVKADANGRSIAVVSMTFGKPGTRPSVSTRWQLMDDHVPADPAVAAIARRWTDAGFAAFRAQGFSPEAVVATTTEPLDGREATVRNRAGRLTDLIAESMARSVGPVDVALFNSGSVRIDDVLPAGPITEYDVIRVLPFGGRIVTAELEGALLARVLETGENNQGLGGFLHAWGASKVADGWWIAGKPIDPVARYRVALTDFLVSGAEINLGFLKRDHPQMHGLREQGDIRRALIEELARAYRPN
jgi:5'-nucleotidase